VKDEQEKLCDVVKDDIIHGSFATTGSRGKKKQLYQPGFQFGWFRYNSFAETKAQPFNFLVVMV
jgi:hypothetical protein